MIFISHRGNINGKDLERENSPGYIIEALNKKYDVEVDIWHKNNKWYLGHDEPKYVINLEKLKKYYNNIWFHCKNIESLEKFYNYKNLTYFWHDNDSYTLTSNNIIWTYPGIKLSSMSICVLPETYNYNIVDLYSCYGICSDYIEDYKNNYYL